MKQPHKYNNIRQQRQTIITKSSTLDVEEVLDPSLGKKTRKYIVMMKIPFEIKDSKTHCKIFWKNSIFGNIHFLRYATCVIIKKGLETRFLHMEKRGNFYYVVYISQGNVRQSISFIILFPQTLVFRVQYSDYKERPLKTSIKRTGVN